jgi:molybdopterin molybdotransferase
LRTAGSISRPRVCPAAKESGRGGCIALEEAWARIEAAVRPLPPVLLPAAKALGRHLSRDVFADFDQPPFPRSPLDGYALRAADSLGASRQTPRTLRVIDHSLAGAPAGSRVLPGQAVRIMTGGQIPAGADCVIRQEDTDCGTGRVQLYSQLRPGQNYCRAGEDYRKGQLLARAGSLVTAGVGAVLAGAGMALIPVNALPRVGVLSTGDELQAAGTPLADGQIYDANAAYLTGRLAELGIYDVQAQRVRDEESELARAVKETGAGCGLILCSGGASVGEKDLVPLVLRRLGGQEIFRGVALKPGMPAALFFLGNTPVLVLSGNPFACAATFELLARKALACLSGDVTLAPMRGAARLETPYEIPRPVRRFFCGTVRAGAAMIPLPQRNGQTHMLADANCLIELPAGEAPLAAGTRVSVYPFERERKE